MGGMGRKNELKRWNLGGGRDMTRVGPIRAKLTNFKNKMGRRGGKGRGRVWEKTTENKGRKMEPRLREKKDIWRRGGGGELGESTLAF